METLYDQLLREFQRLKKQPGFGDVLVSVASAPDLTITWENEAIDLVFGTTGKEVWVLHVPQEAKPELAVSRMRGKEEILQDVSEERAESMARTLLEQLIKVEA